MCTARKSAAISEVSPHTANVADKFSIIGISAKEMLAQMSKNKSANLAIDPLLLSVLADVM
ncbi:hypothetical protein [Arcanobacterium hippocoleae]|uniref:Uncharacterized protein n=1 Tax=Arcanobacterium hippocoleae TaxID=149017 RepID=A0ABU1T206_9ACTO|nr:hypothetical protein [Arcanobacterium hippocoleae]MDR6939311.1 hypothetical protein [Arcanobacterium hippocoleae]